MEALAVLLLVGLMLAALVAPILAIIALVRVGSLSSEVRGLRVDLADLNRRLNTIVQRLASERPPGAAEAGQVAPASGKSAAAVVPATPVEASAIPPKVATPPVMARVSEPARVAAPVPTPPVTPTPIAPPKPPDVVAPLKAPAPPTAATPPTRPAPMPPRIPPSPPMRPRPPAESSFDWESLLGVKGAALLGAVVLIIAGFLFLKLAIDHGLITPAMRVVTAVIVGVGMLVGAEVTLRHGYAITANTISGAGIAILYGAFFTGSSIYHLFPMEIAFALMAMVTVTAGVTAIKYDSPVIAVLGLLGGFATPILLSTGEDRPLGLFAYVLLLNMGLFAVAIRRGWNALIPLCFIGTFLIQIGWAVKFLSPEKLIIGLVVYLLFGLVYLLGTLAARKTDEPALFMTGHIGGVAPFLLAVAVAGSPRYADQWPLLFAFIALLDIALIAVALLRGHAELLLSASLATAVTLPLWALNGLAAPVAQDPLALMVMTFAVVMIGILLNAPARIARTLALPIAKSHNATLESAGFIAAIGLGLFACMLVVMRGAAASRPFLLLLITLVALLFERGGPQRVPGLFQFGSVGVALLTQIWFFASTGEENLLSHLSIPLLLTLAMSLANVMLDLRGDPSKERDSGVVAANVFAFIGLFGCFSQPAWCRHPLPLFIALAMAALLMIFSALKRDWTLLLPFCLGLCALWSTIWQLAYFHAGDEAIVLPITLAFYLLFLALPFLIPEPAAARLYVQSAPWWTSALAGPAFFIVLYRIYAAAWGKATIGLLPLAMAALSVLALAGISRIFVVRPNAPRSAALRLRYLALFAALALGFVAVAIPVQLDRQWMTIGWALEAAAVCWLYGRLPHGGLKVFAVILYTIVGVRLLFNPEVLHYQARGLPIFNWLLYTYGIPALCALAGAAVLRKAEARHDGESSLVPGYASVLGLLLVFWLI
ncbi:MAG: DUF2339 domain-containing protein, partial [Vicinamibacteria bacterium]|nr:DUF2339 domain-containing protein [Vicinamibacteria bacterium]